MSCGGCNAIEYGTATTADGRVVCATCPDARPLYGRVGVQESATMRALPRILERADRAKREAMRERLRRAGTDQVKHWHETES